jgi:hypothetical protein
MSKKLATEEFIKRDKSYNKYHFEEWLKTRN